MRRLEFKWGQGKGGGFGFEGPQTEQGKVQVEAGKCGLWWGMNGKWLGV